MRTNFGEWCVSPRKCRSRGVESNSDPRSLPARDENRRPQRPVPAREVTQVGTAPASAREALDMVRAGLGYLAAADAARLPAAVQAQVLRELEQTDAMAAAARASFLAAFTAGQGHAGDGDYSAVSWLIHRTGITRGAAVGHSAWARRTATHPRVLAALAAGQVSESVGRVICLWTGKLPQEYRDAGDEQLLAAFAAGLGLGDLASLFAEMYVRARGDLPDQDRGREFADREVKLAATIGGAGVVHGDLTAGCAAAVAAVLDALAAPAGKEDDRSKGQRYHDALAEAMTSVTDCVLLCPFHHQVVIHRWGWTLVVNPDGTTSAWNKNKTKVLHSHGPPARAG